MASHMDIASLAAEWVAVLVTLIGLSSLFLQLTSFQNLFDPFRDQRGSDWLGPWAVLETNEEGKNKARASRVSQKQGNSSSSKSPIPSFIRGKAPRGPEIRGTYAKGFCGLNDLHVSRKPVEGHTGKAGWTAILAIFHPNPLPLRRSSVSMAANIEPVVNGAALEEKKSPRNTVAPLDQVAIAGVPEASWRQRLDSVELIQHRNKVCTKITRTALITCLVVTNSYQLYKYSDASGLRRLLWILGHVAGALATWWIRRDRVLPTGQS